jgi:hypothetical protein
LTAGMLEMTGCISIGNRRVKKYFFDVIFFPENLSGLNTLFFGPSGLPVHASSALGIWNISNLGGEPVSVQPTELRSSRSKWVFLSGKPFFGGHTDL